MFSRILSKSRMLKAAKGRRNFSMGPEPGPPPGGYVGFEKIVRTYLPRNGHITIATLVTFYGSIGLYQMLKSPAEEAAPLPAPETSSTDIPSIIDEGFEAWSQVAGNMERYCASLETWVPQ